MVETFKLLAEIQKKAAEIRELLVNIKFGSRSSESYKPLTTFVSVIDDTSGRGINLRVQLVDIFLLFQGETIRLKFTPYQRYEGEQIETITYESKIGKDNSAFFLIKSNSLGEGGFSEIEIPEVELFPGFIV